MILRSLTVAICLTSHIAFWPACTASCEAADGYSSAGPLLVAAKDKENEHTGAETSQEPNANTARAPGEKPFTSGSDFKTGPVTDDEKLIKPVTTDEKQSKTNSKGDARSKIPGEATVQESPNNDVPEAKRNSDLNVDGQGHLSKGAYRVAELIGLLPTLTRIDELKNNQSYTNESGAHSMEAISARQDLDEDILATFLQARRVISELDRQIQAYDAVARVLEEKRDQAIRNNNILNFTSGGALAMTGGALSIGTPMSFQNTGNELATVAGGLAALISAYALKIQKGGKRDSEADPNMLAPIFGLVPASPNKYPKPIWNYINDYEPGQKLSRRQQMIDKWVKLEYIEALDKPSSPKHLKSLAGTIPLHKEVTIDLLRDRIPMLEDTRATVAGVNEYLDEILTFTRKRKGQPRPEQELTIPQVQLK